ncbi:T9SS type A sorting domain-containing protein [Lewinella sp. LCG006]|uniref:T9SS type A sorting domain-containing protein n=1 Tax=Lewinella sp. LCG006 TaxID=3231911 RepID=UPI00346041EF
MKLFTFTNSIMQRSAALVVILMLITSISLQAQTPKVAFVGVTRTSSPDGFSFVAGEAIAEGTVIYFTDEEWRSTCGAFHFDNLCELVDDGEPYMIYTSPTGGLAAGDVVFVSETSTDVLTVTGAGGTISLGGNGGFSLSASDVLFAFDTSNPVDPLDNVSAIYAALNLTDVFDGSDLIGDDPRADFPNAVVTILNASDGEYNPSLRSNPADAMAIMNLANWNIQNPAANLALSTVPFTGGVDLSSACMPVINGITVIECPDNPSGVFTFSVDGALNGATAWGATSTESATCGNYIPQLTFTESIELSFLPPTASFVIFSIGSCQAEQVCYSFVPSELLGIPVFSLATTTYNELDGIQTGLGGATPVGGTYSGPGVTDDGNGMTFSFDPAVAGVGPHSITYTTASGACGSNFSTSVSVTVVAPSITFPALGTVCEGAGIQTITGGATPVGGVYSGNGVTDNGNGTSFTFDPGITGVGSTSLSYTIGSSTASSTLTVAALPTVMFTSSLSTVGVDAGLQTSISGGNPAGGAYSGPGVTDEGNGLSFSFDPAAAGAGEVIVTYTFTDGNGCSDNQSDVITVTDVQLAGDICVDAIDINPLFDGPLNEALVSTIQDNTGYNPDNDPGAGYECWFGDEPLLNNTIWYAFTGDGEKYSIRSIQCDTINPMINTDTQFALYSGDCASPTAVACNDDEDFNNQVYNSYLEIVTEPGVEYLLMVDGYVAAADYSAIGSFCLEVTLLESVGVTDLASTDLKVYPNPTSGELQLPQIAMDRVEVYNATGQLVLKRTTVENTIDLAAQPAGLYLLKIYADGVIYSSKVVKE